MGGFPFQKIYSSLFRQLSMYRCELLPDNEDIVFHEMRISEVKQRGV